jgi:hypothetical protein
LWHGNRPYPAAGIIAALSYGVIFVIEKITGAFA